MQMGAQPGAAGLVGVSLPYAKKILRDLIQGARPRCRAVAGEVAVECAVRANRKQTAARSASKCSWS